MNATLKNAPIKAGVLRRDFPTMTSSTRRLWATRAAIVSYTFIYAWAGVANFVSADSHEGNRIVDMSSLSCGDLLRMPLPKALIAVGWIGGFYAGLKNDPNVNVPEFADKADQIIALCRQNQSTGVMALVERTFHPVQAPSAE